MEGKTLREKQVRILAKDVALLKNTLKRWYNHAGIRFLQERELTDEQEELLADITDFVNDAIDKLEEDEKFLRHVDLPPIQIKRKKAKC